MPFTKNCKDAIGVGGRVAMEGDGSKAYFFCILLLPTRVFYIIEPSEPALKIHIWACHSAIGKT